MSSTSITRRGFGLGAAALTTAATLGSRAYAQGSGKIRVGIIGAGSRCSIDARDMLIAGGDIEIVAIADMFQDKVDSFLGTLNNPKAYWGKYEAAKGKVKVKPDDVYLGFDAADKVLARDDVDMVTLTTPPGFRPDHMTKAVAAGKHIFAEKPGGVDPVGIRKLFAAHEEADRKGLSIVIGTQARRMPHYIETIKRINDGAIGKVVAGYPYWHGGMVDWHWTPKQPGMSDMEHQLRAWPHFVWIGGDHYVEQHLHNLDVMNWVLGTPVKCLARGGQAQRHDKGPIFDHFAVEFEYEGGIRVSSGASQLKGCSDIVGERFGGPDGEAWLSRGGCYITGKNPWKWTGELSSGGREQFADLTGAIRSNKPINECKRLAEATMMAIMGRMSAYTGRAVSWKWAVNASQLDLTPPSELMRLDASLPECPLPVPGQTKLA
ncbi:Gfo/Idh/MocA family oxidoreductase [Planctomycetales bacterium ZRK34]|nr:Gfo/Idh/MocA family oxidoreductase [Planctomycetales bacterium ZRK34]